MDPVCRTFRRGWVTKNHLSNLVIGHLLICLENGDWLRYRRGTVPDQDSPRRCQSPFLWLRPELLECEPEMIGADGLEVAALQSEEAKDFKEDLILRWGSFMRVSEVAPSEEPTGKSCHIVKIR